MTVAPREESPTLRGRQTQAAIDAAARIGGIALDQQDVRVLAGLETADARVDARGDLVLLEDQDRSRWDRAQIAEGSERVERALRLGGGRCVLAVRAAKLRLVTGWGIRRWPDGPGCGRRGASWRDARPR